MRPQIETQVRDGYLLFNVTGSDSLEFSTEYFSSIANECKQRGFKKALVIEELEGQLSTVEMFELGKRLSKIMGGIQVAFIDLVPEHHKDNCFAENVAVNRGGTAQVFQDISRAKNWLNNRTNDV